MVIERDAMIIRHMPLVAFVVGRMSSETSNRNGLDRDDAMAYGTEGLIQAVDSFDPERGTSFASFAVRRIRGSILDAIRKQDVLPRSVRRSARELEQASQELACQLGRWPTNKEIAMRLGLSLDELHVLRSRSSSKVVSLEQCLEDRPDNPGLIWDPADEDEFGNPATATEHRATLGLLKDAMGTLSSRERSILYMRYGQSMPFHEIGALMGLSESRICQLHKKILASLRHRLEPALEEVA
jgi:RNA polymerase sigma factor for flagellar operon FliA